MNNISLLEKECCTGCGLCMNICPTDAIEMHVDAEGFLGPITNAKCVSCGICANSCPALSKNPTVKQSIKSFAAWGTDRVRFKSGSGGVFPMLAEHVIDMGGYVFGAAFESGCRTLIHTKACNKTELEDLFSSKYLQSNTGLCYREVKHELDGGKYVLFAGCPCQVDALKIYLAKDYENLLTIDILCHGVPSPLAYNKFLDEVSNGKYIKSIDFREKEHGGWGKLIKICFEDNTTYFSDWKMSYLRTFSSGLIIRESCFDCQYSQQQRVGDITLGDFWGIQEIDAKLNDNLGTSLVLVNTLKGEKYFQKVMNSLERCTEIPLPETYEISKRHNGAMSNVMKKPRMRNCFFKHLMEGDSFSNAVKYAEKALMDVGILGWWIETPHSNYGSNLTDYALYQYLHTLGLSVAFISPANFDRNNAGEFNKKYDYRMTTKYSYDQMSENNKYFKSYIVASDTLWYYDAMILQGWNFLLDFADDTKRKISYATSFGNTQRFFPESEMPYARYLMHRFNHVSVREFEGVEVCKKKFDINATQVLDPVFLANMSDWEMLANNAKRKTREKFLFSYVLDPTPEKAKDLDALARKLGCKLVTITDRQTNVEYREEVLKDYGVLTKASIEEFVYHLMNAEFIVADSFHGFCFALIFDKPFLALVNKARGASRFDTLSEIAHCKDRMIENISDVKAKGVESLMNINHELIQNSLSAAIRQSKEWLQNALFSEFKQPKIATEIRLEKELYEIKKKLAVLENKIELIEQRN